MRELDLCDGGGVFASEDGEEGELAQAEMAPANG